MSPVCETRRIHEFKQEVASLTECLNVFKSTAPKKSYISQKTNCGLFNQGSVISCHRTPKKDDMKINRGEDVLGRTCE